MKNMFFPLFLTLFKLFGACGIHSLVPELEEGASLREPASWVTLSRAVSTEGRGGRAFPVRHWVHGLFVA